METNIIVQDKTKNTAGFSIIRSKIYDIRGQKVMLDFDLAEMYGTETKVLKQSVKRNMKRFPDDFMFQLTQNEWNELVTNCDHLPKSMKYSYIPSFAFTEQGIAMLSGLLNSDIAINTNIVIMRTFVMIRQHALNYAELDHKIEKLTERMDDNEMKVNNVFKMLTELFEQKKDFENRPRIGFNV